MNALSFFYNKFEVQPAEGFLQQKDVLACCMYIKRSKNINASSKVWLSLSKDMRPYQLFTFALKYHHQPSSVPVCSTEWSHITWQSLPQVNFVSSQTFLRKVSISVGDGVSWADPWFCVLCSVCVLIFSWSRHARGKKRYCRLMWCYRATEPSLTFYNKFLILFLINQTFWDRKTELNTNIKPSSEPRAQRSLSWCARLAKWFWAEFGFDI